MNLVLKTSYWCLLPMDYVELTNSSPWAKSIPLTVLVTKAQPM